MGVVNKIKMRKILSVSPWNKVTLFEGDKSMMGVNERNDNVGIYGPTLFSLTLTRFCQKVTMALGKSILLTLSKPKFNAESSCLLFCHLSLMGVAILESWVLGATGHMGWIFWTAFHHQDSVSSSQNQLQSDLNRHFMTFSQVNPDGVLALGSCNKPLFAPGKKVCFLPFSWSTCLNSPSNLVLYLCIPTPAYILCCNLPCIIQAYKVFVLWYYYIFLQC